MRSAALWSPTRAMPSLLARAAPSVVRMVSSFVFVSSPTQRLEAALVRPAKALRARRTFAYRSTVCDAWLVAEVKFELVRWALRVARAFLKPAQALGVGALVRGDAVQPAGRSASRSSARRAVTA